VTLALLSKHGEVDFGSNLYIIRLVEFCLQFSLFSCKSWTWTWKFLLLSFKEYNLKSRMHWDWTRWNHL